MAGDPVSICGIETTCSAAPRTDEASWLDMLNEIFPSLSARLVSEDFGGSYKQVFARRARRAEDWKLRKEVKTRSRLGSAASSGGCEGKKEKVTKTNKHKITNIPSCFMGKTA